MKIEMLIDEPQEIVDEAFTLPLSGGKTVVNTERIKEIIDDMRSNLPVELKQAKSIAADRTNIINKSKAEAERIVQEAEDRFGPVLLGRRDPVLLEFLTRRTAVMEKILRSVRDAAQKSSDDPVLLQRHSAKIREIEHSLTVYHAALTAYDKPWRKS